MHGIEVHGSSRHSSVGSESLVLIPAAADFVGLLPSYTNSKTLDCTQDEIIGLITLSLCRSRTLSWQSDIPDPVKVSLVVHHQALLRNKRCLLTYLKRRADRFEWLVEIWVVCLYKLSGSDCVQFALAVDSRLLAISQIYLEGNSQQAPSQVHF